MDGFEYLVALLSVVAALGLARALSGIAKLVHLRNSISFSWVHVLWTINILVWLIAYWWFSFILSTIDTWTPQLLIFVLVYGATIYFLIALLYPDNVEKGTDFFDYFIDNRRWFFGTFLLLGVMDILDSLLKSSITESGGPPLIPYIIFMSIWIIPSGLALHFENKSFHAVYAVGFFLALMGYLQYILYLIEI